MLSKNNQGLQQQKLAAQRQRFGLRKLNIGVTSVLLGASLLWWAGAKPAQAATDLAQSQPVTSTTATPNVATKNTVELSKTTDSTNTKSVNSAVPTQSTTVSPADQSSHQPVSTTEGSHGEQKAQDATPTAPTVVAKNGGVDQPTPAVPTQQEKGNSAALANDKNQSINDATMKVADATPTTITGTYTEGPNGQETVAIPGASLSIDHNMLDLFHNPNSGQINLTFNINSAKAGDTFVITVPTDYGCNPAGMSGTPNVKVSGPDWGRYTITVLADITGTSTVTLTTKIIESDNSYGAASSPIEKLGTVVEAITLTKNGVPVDQSLHFTYVTDPAATIRVNPITSPSTNNGAVVPGVDNVYTFTINGAAGMVANDPNPSNWVYSGTNYGAIVTIPVPKGFVLNQELTNLLNQSSFYGTVSQAGVGSDIVVTVPKGTGTQNWNCKPGLRLVGRFDVTATAQNQTITAAGNPTLEQKILYTNADGSTTMRTVTKENTPWTVTILGSQVPLQDNSGVNVWGAQGNNQLVLNPQATTDPNPDVLNKVLITNASGLSFDNTNLPADQQARITITIPDGLTINKIATPKDDVNLPGTTSYDYVLTLADGQTIKGTVAAGETVTTPGAAITRAVFTPNFLASFAAMNGDASFQLFGRLANQYATGQPVKNGDVLTTTAQFSFGYEGKSYGKSADNQQTVSGVTIGFSLGGIFQNPWVSNQPGTGNYVGVYGSSQGNYGYTYEPVFYYVLPTDVYANLNYNDIRANFANGAVIGSADGKTLPALSTYEVDGHQVVKIDYTGTGISVPTGGGNAFNTLNYTINPDALPGVYSGDQGGQIYVVSPQDLLVGDGAEEKATPDQINTYLQGNPGGKNAYFLGNFSLTVNSGQALGVNELSQGNDDPVPVGNATSTDKNRPDMEIDFNLVNTANSTTGEKMVAVENVPVKDDQYGNQFDFTMIGPAEYEPAQGSIPEGDIQFLYSTTAYPEPNGQQVGAMPDLIGYVTADQVTDWSTIKSVAEIIPNGLAVNTMAGRVVIHGKDATQLTDAGKKIYAQAIFFRADGLPVVNSVNTHPDITNIAVVGNSTVNVALQYQYNGQTVTVTVPALAKTYQDNQSTMEQGDFTNLNHDAIVQALIANGVPAAVAQHFLQDPDAGSLTIKNGTNASWKANWPDAENGTAAFGQKVQYYFDGDTVVVKLVHETQTVAPETKTVTRTINVTDPVTGKVTTTTQTANFTRTDTKDLVTGTITPGVWNADQKWDEFKPAVIDGYTASQLDVPEVKVTADDTDQMVNITYTANEQSTQIQYVTADGQPATQPDGTVVPDVKVDGKTNEKVAVTDAISNGIPTNWELVPDQDLPTDVTFTADGAAPIKVKIQHKTQDVSDTDPQAKKTVTRTINVTNPVTKVMTPTVQTATFHRTATKDLVTGTVTYGQWNNDQKWDAFDVPAVAGYTPTETTVPEQAVRATDDNTTVNITYTANDETVKVLFEDGQGNIIQTTPITGKMDSIVDLTKTTIPTGWVLDGTDPRTADYKLSTTNPDVIVKIKHGTQALPDETKTVIRTINVQNPVTSKVTTTKQTANFRRTATKDLVTGTITYGGWNTDQKWDAFTTPTIDGYTPSQASVAGEDVTANDTDQTVNIDYTANDQTASLTIIDDTTNQTLVTDSASGKFGQTISFPDLADQLAKYKKDGYVLVSNGLDGQTYQADNAKNAFTVHLKHGTQDVTTTDPGATKTVTRTINVTDPVTGKVTTTTQTANFHRTATKDLVTNKVTYGDWNTDQKWDAFTTPTIDGYTPTVKSVPEQPVAATDSDATVNIEYTANNESVNVIFRDSATGQDILTTLVTGKMGSTVDLTKTTIPTGWVLDGTDPRTANYKLGTDNPAVIVKIKHGTQALADETKTVTRTINVKNPVTGEVTTTTQTASFHRTATKDLVTGDISYGGWNTDQKWAKYTVPTVAGYTPSQATVAEKAVKATDQDVTVNVTYTANEESVKVIFEDSEGNVISEQTIGGKTGQTVNTKDRTSIPAGWVIDGTDPRGEVTLTANTPDVIVHIMHGLTTSTQTKMVTRTIVVNLPDGTTKTIPQTATFTRTVIEDLVTDAKTYGKWSADQTWAEYTPDQIAGYVATPASVPAQTVTPDTADTTVTITYASVGDANQAPSQGASAVPGQTPGEGSSATPTPGKGIRTTPAGMTKPATKDPAATQKRLPQTGNANRKATAIAGLTLMGVVASLFGMGKERKHEN